MKTRIVKGATLKKAVARGVGQLADAVAATLGPRGRNVILGQKIGVPTPTNDGVTVAKEITLPQPVENIFARIMKEASLKTNTLAGDGTTTAIVLARKMVVEGLRHVAAGVPPNQLKRDMEAARDQIVAELQAMARRVDLKAECSHTLLKDIATISAGDETIGRLVADAATNVGAEGIVVVEEGKSARTTLEIVKGMQVDKGWISPYFVTNPDRSEAVLDNPIIILFDGEVADIAWLTPLLEGCIKEGRSVLLIAHDVVDSALATFVINKLRGTLKCAAIKAQWFGADRAAFLEDLAVVTGGTVLNPITRAGLSPGQIRGFVGRAKQVIIGREATTIIDGAGDAQNIEARKTCLRGAITECTEKGGDEERAFKVGRLQERLARLAGGVAVVGVGGKTESEIKVKKFKVEDAMRAVQCAMKHGVVPGGGAALIHAGAVVDATYAGPSSAGRSVVMEAIKEPLRQIAENAGKNGDFVVQNVIVQAGVGYDVHTGTYHNLLEAGVIDPVLVTITALETAVSVAGLVLTTEVAIIPVGREERKKPRIPKGGL